MKIEDIDKAEDFVMKMQHIKQKLRHNIWSLKGIRDGNKLVYVSCDNMPTPSDIVDGAGAEELRRAIVAYLENRCEELAAEIGSAVMIAGQCSKDELRQSLPVGFPDWKESKDAI